VKRRDSRRIQSSKKRNVFFYFLCRSDLKQDKLIVNVSVGKSKGKELFGLSGCRWVADIEMVVR
jgi:hypothetical protein